MWGPRNRFLICPLSGYARRTQRRHEHSADEGCPTELEKVALSEDPLIRVLRWPKRSFTIHPMDKARRIA